VIRFLPQRVAILGTSNPRKTPPNWYFGRAEGLESTPLRPSGTHGETASETWVASLHLFDPSLLM